METSVVLRSVRLSAQKGRLVVNQIRGLQVDQAIKLLTFSPKKGAVIVLKLLESAVANAEHNEGADIDELKITQVFVGQGSSLKRVSPRAKGRGNRISKPTCNIFLTVCNR